jgi:aspartate kinase
VLHSRAVEFAKKFKIRLHVRSSFSLENGTIVMPMEEMVEKYIVSGITIKQNEAKVTIRDIPDKPGISAKLFNALGSNNIYVNMIVQSTGQDNRASISFTVKKEDLAKTKELCTALNKDFGGSSVEAKEDIAIVSAVGIGMLSHYGVAGKMFGVLSEQNINIEMISTSEIGISCVIDGVYAELAAKALHKSFMEEN